MDADLSTLIQAGDGVVSLAILWWLLRRGVDEQSELFDHYRDSLERKDDMLMKLVERFCRDEAHSPTENSSTLSAACAARYKHGDSPDVTQE